VRAFFTRSIRAVRLLAHDGRIPRPLRWAAAFGVLPIPGPLDELVLALVAGVLWLFYRDRLRDAWARTGHAETQQKPGSSLSRITGA
jgi:hypothetical protein